MGKFTGKWETHVSPIKGKALLIGHPDWEIPPYEPGQGFSLSLLVRSDSGGMQTLAIPVAADNIVDNDTRFTFTFLHNDSGLTYYGDFRRIAFERPNGPTIIGLVAVVRRGNASLPGPDDDMGSFTGISKGSGW
jgi:hypothetical protein